MQISFHCGFKYSSTSIRGIHLGFPNTKYGFNVVSNRVQSRFEVDSFRISDPGARATFSTVWIHFECKYRFIVVSNTVQPRLGGFIWGSRIQNMASMWFQIEFNLDSRWIHSGFLDSRTVESHCGFKFPIHLGFPNTKYGFNVVSNRVQIRGGFIPDRWNPLQCKYRFIVVSNTVQPRLVQIQNMASMWFHFNLYSRWIHSGFPIRGPGPHLVLCESTLNANIVSLWFQIQFNLD